MKRLLAVLGVSLLLAACTSVSERLSEDVGGIVAETIAMVGGSDYGIGPGKWYVDNYRRGLTAEGVVVVYNGSDEPKEINLWVRVPGDGRSGGYTPGPPELVGWVTVTPSTILLPPRSTNVALVVLTVPELQGTGLLGAFGKAEETLPGKWEFEIAVKDVTQTSIVQIAYGQRWLVTMYDD